MQMTGSCACGVAGSGNRRQLLRWGGAMPVLGLLAALKPHSAKAAGKTEALLLSCMDYRLADSNPKCNTCNR